MVEPYGTQPAEPGPLGKAHGGLLAADGVGQEHIVRVLLYEVLGGDLRVGHAVAGGVGDIDHAEERELGADKGP